MDFIETPKAPAQPAASKATGVRTTDFPAIKNGTLIAEGAGAKSFSNMILFGLLIGAPFLVTRKLGGGCYVFTFFAILFAIPLLMAYWTFASNFSPRINENCKLPNRGIDHYLKFKDPALREKYNGKIPMEVFQELYFDGQVDFKGDVLDVMEERHDWAKFSFTRGLFKFFLTGMIPEVIFHTRGQDEEQVRENYDRGNDFYSWFLGPRMIYTSGIISDPTKEETLEELQDNKLRIVAEKVGVQEGDLCLDIGCGWGTLTRYFSKVYGAKVTGVTLSPKQVEWGMNGLASDGTPDTQSKVIVCDYRDAPVPPQKYKRITSLEMSEHVGIRNFKSFLQQIYDMLDDDGVFFMQYSGLRKSWQYEDLIWGLFMNKYIFPGADASTPLGWTVDQLEATGFEITSIDTVGVGYSATIWNWYRNWMGNREKVVAKYGEKWFRIWAYFLSYSTIVSRQGSATCFQIVLRKNLNAVHRAEYIPNMGGIQYPLKKHASQKWL